MVVLVIMTTVPRVLPDAVTLVLVDAAEAVPEQLVIVVYEVGLCTTTTPGVLPEAVALVDVPVVDPPYAVVVV